MKIFKDKIFKVKQKTQNPQKLNPSKFSGYKVFVCVCVCVHVCMFVFVYFSACVCLHVCAHACTSSFQGIIVFTLFNLQIDVDVTVETTYSAITILEGDDITLSCRPSQSDIALQWSYNGSDINSSPQYQFNPPFLNHDLTITNADGNDSGNYVCAFILRNETIDEQSITLTVVPSE